MILRESPSYDLHGFWPNVVILIRPWLFWAMPETTHMQPLMKLLAVISYLLRVAMPRHGKPISGRGTWLLLAPLSLISICSNKSCSR